MVTSFVLAACIASTQAPEPTFRVGRLLIEGNTDTPDHVILAQIDFGPGRKTTGTALRKAEQRIRATGVFKSNPWRGTGATIEALANEFDSEFRDILIRVEERRGNYLPFGLTEMILAHALYDNERLFDETWRLAIRLTQVFRNR